MKRLLDIVVSVILLALFSPLMLLVALGVLLAMGRPVLFRQLRPGLRGVPFTMLKFRSMTDSRDIQGRLLPAVDRQTPLGSILRRTSLDELPQLLNVLRGDMSLVGPRPLAMQYLPLYTPEQARRHEVRPGITGWAQIHGRSAITWEHRLGLDVWYVDHISAWLDVAILLRTPFAVLRIGWVDKAPDFTGLASTAAVDKGSGTGTTCEPPDAHAPITSGQSR